MFNKQEKRYIEQSVIVVKEGIQRAGGTETRMVKTKEAKGKLALTTSIACCTSLIKITTHT